MFLIEVFRNKETEPHTMAADSISEAVHIISENLKLQTHCKVKLIYRSAFEQVFLGEMDNHDHIDEIYVNRDHLIRAWVVHLLEQMQEIDKHGY